VSRYSLSATKTTGAAAGLIAQLRTGSARDLRIWEVGVFATTAVSGSIGLIRPSAVGATFTSTAAGQPEDPVSGAGVAVIDTVAGTPPTIGATYLRQATLPATIGAGVIWTFPNGLVVPISASMALWQTSALAVGYALYFVYDE
jgi:hypothetical protein